ncbi:hypothetical protein FOA52_002184 [Chlamydomonas sp. UWO 241]|nr:hypothetical protein FOA52_002184 [Chlamydomonas sp. UWO 241]
MGSLYLKRYIDRVADVPGELRRHLALIRDLDEKAQVLQADIEAHSGKSASRSKKGPAAGGYDLASAVTKLVSLADEKVTIAAQVYDFIDKHIQGLDEDLRSLDGEIRADRQRLMLGEDETARDALDARAHRGRGGRPPASAAAGDKSNRKKRKLSALEGLEEEDAAGSHLLPIQADNEPLYCYCQKPSHGEMVACDHDECAVEWFHYECVGLTAAPTGEWHCPDCAKIIATKKAAAA